MSVHRVNCRTYKDRVDPCDRLAEVLGKNGSGFGISGAMLWYRRSLRSGDPMVRRSESTRCNFCPFCGVSLAPGRALVLEGLIAGS